MLIAVEGPDGAGKTTFVEQLRQFISKELGDAEVFHSGPPTQWAVSEYELGTQHYRPGQGRHVIYDRLHMGEQVYGPIYRAGGMKPAAWEHVCGWMNRLGCLTVLIMPPIDEVRENLRVRGDDMVHPVDLEEIYQRYASTIVGYKLPQYVLDRYPTERDVFSVVKLAMRMEQLYADTARFTSFVGWKYPAVLLVGDTKSAKAGNHIQAFVPWPGYSGEYLMNAINGRWITWALVNALEDDILEVVATLKPQSITTLGVVADHHCALLGVNVTTHALHPSYAMRRKQMPLEQYRNTL